METVNDNKNHTIIKMAKLHKLAQKCTNGL